MTNEISTLMNDSLVAFASKKGDLQQITAEGAVFKGGVALAALKDSLLEVALIKAGHGKYRAASDILVAAYPAVAKKVEGYHETPAWAKKFVFLDLVKKCDAALPGKNGYTKRQQTCRLFLAALKNTLGVVAPAEVVETAEA